MYRYVRAAYDDMVFFHEIKRNDLLNLTWSDSDMFESGEKIRVIPDEYKSGIKFWKNDVYEGHYAVTYNGEVVWDGMHMKTNQTTAQKIVDGIENGYETDHDYLFED